MSSLKLQESVTLDSADRAVIRALQLAPRGSFSAIGEVLGLSEQTVARRYRRLCREGVLRVVAVVSPEAVGQSSWMVRVRCRPDGTAAIASALARRDDVGWVALAAGGSEVVCAVRSRSREQREDLLLQRLPRTAPVLGVAASVLLHWFVGGRADDWTGYSEDLTADQARRLAAIGAGPDAAGFPQGRSSADVAGPRRPAERVRLEPEDEPLIGLLVRSGRASYAELAAAAGISEGRAARRLARLLAAGVIYLDVDLSAPLLGYEAQASLWLTVTPAKLDAAGTALRAHSEVAFAAAISGPQNLVASVTCRDLDHLYRFATLSAGALPGVQALEISPVLRHVKQSGAIISGGYRLIDAPAQPHAPVRQPRG
ncbi:MAG TPA: Lrp/AsnC family transcriptional regulator [Streptosporangiaceae bacterium]|nr:Lrp/AsnC family transcriptional regulator [Streptosporangiaceae bacterium]